MIGTDLWTHLPEDLICKIIASVSYVGHLDHLLRLSCLNKTMRSFCVMYIHNLHVWDELLANSIGEFLKSEVVEHTGRSLRFEKINHEAGKPKVHEIVGRSAFEFHCSLGGNRIDLEPGPEARQLTNIRVYNGYIRLRGGLSFRFPGQDYQKEIELLVTMNAIRMSTVVLSSLQFLSRARLQATMNEIGISTVVLSSLDGNCIISNLDSEGLKLPAGSPIDKLLELFDRSAGSWFFRDFETEELLESMFQTWDMDMDEYQEYILDSTD